MLQQRKDIIAFLGSKGAPQLSRVDGGSKAPEGAGRVSVNFDEGYVVLVRKGEDNLDGARLVWAKDDKELKRPLAAGEYQVRRYVVTRKDEKGVLWHLWADGQGRSVVVKAGAETQVELDLDVTFKNQTQVSNGKVAAGGGFSGDSGMGLSLVKGDGRVTPRWRLVAAGKDLASGDCAYG